jgi:Zn-finger nucleic acid-binding protein
MLRDEFPTCPSCTYKLDPVGPRLRCGGCEGLFVPHGHLAEMFELAAPDTMLPPAVRPARRAEQRPCPRCKVPMAPSTLEGIEVDACDDHGVWFDFNELAWVLEMIGLDYSQRNPSAAHTGRGGKPHPPSRAGLPVPPPLRRSWWQKFFGIE